MIGVGLRRIGLFILTNMLVLLLLGIVLRVLGVEQYGIGTGGLLIFASLFGFGGSFISLALSKWIAKRATRARVLDVPRDEVERWLLSTVERQANKAGIGTPEVAIFPSDAPNAFATGMSRNNALVAVSEGLLRAMGRREVEAVLAHEVAHIANGDMVTLALLQGVMNTFVIFLSRLLGTLIDRAVFRSERGYGIGYWVTVIALEIVFGLLAGLVVRAFSRWREYRADRGAAELEDPQSMIRALQALQRMQELPSDMPKQLAAFGIRGEGSVARLFSTHPPLSKRIQALRALQR
ncbi:MAG: protease HtpX [Deltaproteobacteria bacterium]|nr:MAG: protease HtpX [Deltaproteobacteria bacterium]